MRPAFLALALASCTGASSPQAPTATASSLRVVALSQPAGWLASRLVGDDGQVTVMVPAGEDPPHWRPSADAIALLADADLLVANGAGYEPWIATASLPRDRLVDTAKGLDLIVHEGTTHSHGATGTHTHEGTDPHTWLDPLLFLSQGQAIHRHLVQDHPGHRDAFDARLEALRTEILAVHGELETALAGLDRVALAANHPSYDYLARRYGFGVNTFPVEPDAAPDAATAAPLSAWTEEHREDAPSKPVMLWESAPTPEVTAALSDGLRHVVVDPVEQPLDGRYDWPARMRSSAAALHAVLPPTTGASGK